MTNSARASKEAAAVSRAAALVRDGRLAEARRMLLHEIDGEAGMAACTNVALLETLYFASREAVTMALAATAAKRWADVAPESARAHGIAGEALVASGDDAAAEPHLRRAVELDPSRAEPWTALGHVLLRAKRADDALDAFRTARRLAPDRPAPLLGELSVFLELGEVDAVRALLREEERRFQWDDRVMAFAALILNFVDGESTAELVDAHRRYGEVVRAAAASLPPWMGSVWRPAAAGAPSVTNTGATSAGARDTSPTSRHGTRSLRVGFFSPDVRRHAVATFLMPFLRHAKDAGLDLIAFNLAPLRDDVTAEIASLAPMHDVAALDDTAIVKLARGQRLDVAIDLAGLSHGHRHGPFAARVAPLQMTWLGYPATTGVPGIDMRIVDADTDPPGSEGFGTERLLRLDRPFLAWEPPIDPARIPVAATADASASQSSASSAHRDERPVTFGSFNAIAKISPRTIDLWSRVLRAVPSSRMRLKAAGLAHPRAAARALEAFAAHGVDRERIEVMPWQATIEGHFRSYDTIDLALDTMPYNGTTTTVEALFMGTPVVVLEGDRHASRVGAMIMRAVGAGDFVAKDASAFVDIASAWAARPTHERALFRTKLREQLLRSPLCDGASLASAIAAGLRSGTTSSSPATSRATSRP